MTDNNSIYKGVIVPMVSPFSEDFNIDVEAVKKIVSSFIKHEISPFLLGTTGESFSISNEQKSILVKATIDAADKKVPVYAGVSSNSIHEAIENSNLYAQMGVDAVVAHLPFYFPITNENMVKWFKQLADNIDCPLILYNNPFTTNISLPLEVTEELSYHKNIVGVKDSERGVERLDMSVDLWAKRSDFVYLLGWAAMSAYALKKGAKGIVPSIGNVTPDLYACLYSKAISGKHEEAKQLQKQTDEISDFCYKNKSLSEALPALKIMMSAFDLCQPVVMPPMYNPSEEVVKKIKEYIATQTEKL